MRAEEIIDYVRTHPDHPPTISPYEWAAVASDFAFLRMANDMSSDHAIRLWNENFTLKARIKELEEAILRMPDPAEVQRLNRLLTDVQDFLNAGCQPDDCPPESKPVYREIRDFVAELTKLSEATGK
jgi:hypothetical protein